MAGLIDRPGRAIEDYLKAVFSLQTDDEPVSTTALAQRLSVSPAAATKAVQLLASRGLATHRPYRGVTLTTPGRKEALQVIRRHRLLERFLHDVLGYAWDEVDAEAERLEHHISDRFVDRIDHLLNYPQHDPHGAPIPAVDGTVTTRQGQPLADCAVCEVLVVVRVRDQDPEVLQYLGRLGLRPGVEVEVLERQPFDGPLTLRIRGSRQQAPCVLGRKVAGSVYVEPFRPADQQGGECRAAGERR